MESIKDGSCGGFRSKAEEKEDGSNDGKYYQKSDGNYKLVSRCHPRSSINKYSSEDCGTNHLKEKSFIRYTKHESSKCVDQKI